MDCNLFSLNLWDVAKQTGGDSIETLWIMAGLIGWVPWIIKNATPTVLNNFLRKKTIDQNNKMGVPSERIPARRQRDDCLLQNNYKEQRICHCTHEKKWMYISFVCYTAVFDCYSFMVLELIKEQQHSVSSVINYPTVSLYGHVCKTVEPWAIATLFSSGFIHSKDTRAPTNLHGITDDEFR